MAVRITRKDKGELRQEAARCRDGKAARRMLAIALVLDGVDRKTAAENCGMDRHDWAHRYNAEGVSVQPSPAGSTLSAGTEGGVGGNGSGGSRPRNRWGCALAAH